ncbi:methionine synthase [Streptomyces sp. NPDC005438]|uniref:methionine synthase n=1 Tax=Streptomyces sp. NPDC005438 TaxID=3156880 RepID=UPI0033A8CD90
MSEKNSEPWGTAAATGVGSMPGTDAREAARTVLGTLDALPALPELPARGPGADMIGRTVGLLAELYAAVEPSGWRVTDRAGRDTRRARAWMREDLDALEEFSQDRTGALKVSVVGPWTLAAALERRGGEAMLGDPGACRYLAESLAEGLGAHLAELRRRFPRARLVVQLDEPSLPSVLAGRVRTASKLRTHAPVDRAVVESTLRRLREGFPEPLVVHCCAPGVPVGSLRAGGADAVSLDLSLLTEREYEAVAEAIDAGVSLFAGVVPASGSDPAALSDPASNVGGVRSLWRRLGFSPGLLAESVVITPTCGLAGASPAYARAALAHCLRAAESLADNPE